MKTISILPMILFLSLLSSNCQLLWAEGGDLDPSFGIGGKVTTNFLGISVDSANAMVIQNDGKIILAGSYHTNSDFALARYNTDGSLDSSFGNAGLVITDMGQNEIATALVLQNDGKLVVVGWTSFLGSNGDFALARYNTDGSLDATFGNGGIVITDLGNEERGTAVAIQTDGKIVVVGNSSHGDVIEFALARYNTNGSLDGSFGSGGKITTVVSGPEDSALAVLIQNDGKILAIGNAGSGGDSNFALVRYNTNGSIDTSFGTSGIVLTDFGGHNDYGVDAFFQSDGKIVVAGSAQTPNPCLGVARYNPDGSLDNSFSNDGKATITDSTWLFGTGARFQSDGKIVMSGYSIDMGTDVRDFAVARFNTDGTPDGSFGNGGLIKTDFAGFDDYGRAVAIQSDDKILVAGDTCQFDCDFALARYLNDCMTISPTSLPDGIPGTPYSQTITVTGGTAPYTFNVTSGSLPAGLSLDSNTGVISGTPLNFGVSNFRITANDSASCDAHYDYQITIVQFSDDFEDGMLDGWVQLKGVWTDANGDATATTLGKTDLLSPSFPSCTQCTYESVMRVSTGGRLSMYAWYESGSNYVEVRLMQDKHKILVKQKAGALSGKRKALIQFQADTFYDIEISFDGTDFHVFVDGVEYITLPAVQQPSGNMKLRVKAVNGRNTTGAFESVSVH